MMIKVSLVLLVVGVSLAYPQHHYGQQYGRRTSHYPTYGGRRTYGSYRPSYGSRPRTPYGHSAGSLPGNFQVTGPVVQVPHHHSTDNIHGLNDHVTTDFHNTGVPGTLGHVPVVDDHVPDFPNFDVRTAGGVVPRCSIDDYDESNFPGLVSGYDFYDEKPVKSTCGLWEYSYDCEKYYCVQKGNTYH